MLKLLLEALARARCQLDDIIAIAFQPVATPFDYYGCSS